MVSRAIELCASHRRRVDFPIRRENFVSNSAGLEVRLADDMSPSRQVAVADEASPCANAAKVCAIVVTHQPDCDGVVDQLAALRPQVERIVFVDNASDESVRHQLRRITDSNAQLIELPENIGVGAAHNIGIRIARNADCSHVLLLDHDSVPDAAMVEHLIDGLRIAESTSRVSAVGPMYQDPRTGQGGRFVRLRKEKSETPDGLTPVDFLITSGSLIPIAVFEDVGLFDANLFVDYVDTEWCLRATDLGYRLFGVPAATMFHTIGDDVTRTLGFSIPAYSPRRLYYQARNPFLLPGVSRGRTWLRVLRLCLFHGLLRGPRFLNLRMLFRGVRDGRSGKLGRIDFANDRPGWEALLRCGRSEIQRTDRASTPAA